MKHEKLIESRDISYFKLFLCEITYLLQTQFLLRCRIDPAKGGELCRASSICSLSITLEQIGKSSHTSLMYEVSYLKCFFVFFFIMNPKGPKFLN